FLLPQNFFLSPGLDIPPHPKIHFEIKDYRI
ncbi:Uncharacterized protein TCM_011540 isoform 2, partial [Theobroma cacao]